MTFTSFVSCSKQILFHSDLESQPLSVITPHQGETNYAIFNHNAHVVASGGKDGAIDLYHLEKKVVVLSLIDKNTGVSS